MIKEAILTEEKQKIATFLFQFELELEKGIDLTLYYEENGRIVGTISKEGYIIKCLAVDKTFQGQNIASKLVSEIVSRIIYEGNDYYQVFTKKMYRDTFLSLGFSEIFYTEETSVLECSSNTIDNFLEANTRRLTFYTDDIACVVVNCNPITRGHLYLIEKASKEHDHVLVFVLEEDKSYFTFQERMSLVFLAVKHLNNVTVLPSTRYMISSLTFPSYFIKEETKKNYEYAKIDTGIFKKYFMKYYKIKYRYVGEETSEIMKIYNETLKELLKTNLIVVPRLDSISASKVRELIFESKLDDALEYIPESVKNLLVNIIKSKELEHHSL